MPKTTTSAKTTAKKTVSSGKTLAKTQPKARIASKNSENRVQPTIRAEVIAIIVMAVSIILLVSLFSTSGAGSFGSFVKATLISLFGLGAYLIPITASLVCLMVVFTDGLKILKSNIIMFIALFIIVISFVHILGMTQEMSFSNVAQYIEHYYKSGSVSNGGLFGAAFGNVLILAIGKTGAFIALLFSGVILLILITGRSLFSVLRKAGSKANAIIDRKKRQIVMKGPLKKDAKLKVKSMSDRKIEVFDEPRRRNAKQMFNHVINSDESDVTESKIDVINERFRDSISKPPKGKIVEFKPVNQEIESVLEVDNTEISKDDEYADDGFFEATDKVTPDKEKLEETCPIINTDLNENGKHLASSAKDVSDDFQITVKGIGIEGAEIVKPDLSNISSIADEDDVEILTAEYEYPQISLLNENTYEPSVSTMVQIKENSRKLEETLKSFGVEARVTEVSKGPTVTRYELSPGVGVKVNKISGLADDLALSLAAMSIRIEAPIPGKSAVGIELPNKETQPVFIRELMADDEFKKQSSRLSFAVGKDIAGNTIVADIAKMPHLLIAGSTGSGKSVCINTLITSILFNARPDEVKMIMVDPKMVELSIYNGIPHLLIPVVTDPKKAAGALNWAVLEMERRYALLAGCNVRDLKSYNALMQETGGELLPQILIIIDELADLMVTSGKEVEEAINRIAAKARAAAIHLVLATQRPSVNVITGTIKANVPSRLAFAVTSGIDSRTILDQVGAERLLGKGDMLFSPMGLSKPLRVQGAFISDKEVERVVNYLKEKMGETRYDPAMIDEITAGAPKGSGNKEGLSDQFVDAVVLILEKEKASTSMLQRYFRIGYNSAARLMEELEERGIVGPEDGVKPRKILITRTEWENFSL